MRDVLLKRIKPLVDRLATELADLMVARIGAELDRVNVACEVAVSAYADDCSNDIIATAIDPDLAAMLSPTMPTRQARGFRAPVKTPAQAPIAKRDIKPAIEINNARRGRTDKTALQANGKQPPTCKKCGFIGGNKRGCGRSHATQPKAAAPTSDSDEDEGAVSGEIQSAQLSPSKILEWDEQRRLIALVQQHDDKRALDALVRGNMGLVHRLARKCPWHVMPYEDVVQEGVIGLMKGIRGFDLASPYKLSTYASHWIWHYVVRSHENGAAIRMPARLGMALVKVSRAQFKLEEKLGRSASEDELAAAAKLDVRDVQKVLHRGQVTTSIDVTDADDQSFMHDRLASGGPNAEDDLVDSDTLTELMTAVDELSPRAAQIVRHRFIDGMTLDEAAEAIGAQKSGRVLSRERVRQIERVALETLKRKLGSAARAA